MSPGRLAVDRRAPSIAFVRPSGDAWRHQTGESLSIVGSRRNGQVVVLGVHASVARGAEPDGGALVLEVMACGPSRTFIPQPGSMTTPSASSSPRPEPLTAPPPDRRQIASTALRFGAIACDGGFRNARCPDRILVGASC
jgi:hypothetical protein